MDSRIPVTISIGLVSSQGADVSKMQELIAESERLVYAAKSNGKNLVVTA
jgi:PleD family two-component response regulator